jgi:hypothetical protein
MPSNRQTVVQPLGLILSPNPFGQYPDGALSKAENVVMRVPGEIWQAPDFGAFVYAGGTTNDQFRKLYPLDAGYAYAFSRNASLVWSTDAIDTGAGTIASATLPVLTNTTGLYFDTGQIWPVRARERMLVNTANAGVYVGDSMAPSSAALRALRHAGMPQPTVTLSISGTNAGTIPASTLVGYCAVLKRVYADGYQIFGPPSPIISEPGVAFISDVTAFVTWANGRGVVAGDFVEVYRTDGINGAPFNGDPGETMKLVVTYTLTAADITTQGVFLKIQQVMSAPLYQTTGRELYTNPGQETALQANRQPNISEAMAKFKSFVFFGGITERPAWTFTVPAGISIIGTTIPNNPFNRANAIGIRQVTGTITSGSATITGIAAADLVGVVVGQIVPSGVAQWTAGASITAVGATTITMSVVATANGTSVLIRDVFVLDGTTYYQRADIDIVNQLQSFGGNSNYETTVDNRIIDSIVGYTLGTTFRLEPLRPNQLTMTIKATNGQNYQPPVPEFTATAKTLTGKRTANLVQWSKDSEPEHVPPSNETNVGTATIIAFAETRNALWIFATDGLYRLSGDAPPWRVDLMDPNIRLVAPQAFTVLRDVVWAYTNYGIVAITDAGIEEITQTTLDQIFNGPAYSGDPTIIMERNELADEIIISINTGVWYVFSTKQKAWTTLNKGNYTSSCTAIAFQARPASGQARLITVVSVSGFSAFYAPWLPFEGAASYLLSDVRFQPMFGEDPLVMKQYIDETLIFSVETAGRGLSVLEGTLGQIATSQIAVHGGSAWATVGFPRSCAIALQSAPGFSIGGGAVVPFKFRGISQRYALCTNQAWRK